MLTSKEIRSTTFVTVRKGYAIEDVDAFLNKVAGELDALQNECAAMLKEKDEALEAVRSEKKEIESKMMVLADKVEDYRNQENILHNAFINAEKMKESVLEEARQTSDILIRDAQQKADRIIEAATGRVAEESSNYEALQREVAKFKNAILDAYKSHLGLIASLPDSVSDVELKAAMEEIGQDVPEEQSEPETAVVPEEETETAVTEEETGSMLGDIIEDSGVVDDLLDEAERSIDASEAPSSEEDEPSGEEEQNDDSSEAAEPSDRFSF